MHRARYIRASVRAAGSWSVSTLPLTFHVSAELLGLADDRPADLEIDQQHNPGRCQGHDQQHDRHTQLSGQPAALGVIVHCAYPLFSCLGGWGIPAAAVRQTAVSRRLPTRQTSSKRPS
jgi:hypothetical protein